MLVTEVHIVLLGARMRKDVSGIGVLFRSEI